MSISVAEDSSGLFTARVVADDTGEELHATDPVPSRSQAAEVGKRWWDWFDGLSAGRVESIYYVLAVPDVWPGPMPGAMPYSGLKIKIGRARDVRRRMRDLRTGTSAKLIVHALEPGDSALEARRHSQFADDRRQGEWFSCSPKLVAHVFATWRKHQAMFKEDQEEVATLMHRSDILRGARQVFGGPPDMINPSLSEEWRGNVFIDLVYANPLWKKRP